jgi:hypothetical protein
LVITRPPAAGVLHDDERVAGNVRRHVPRHKARQNVVGAARSAAYDEANLLAAEKGATSSAAFAGAKAAAKSNSSTTDRDRALPNASKITTRNPHGRPVLLKCDPRRPTANLAGEFARRGPIR